MSAGRLLRSVRDRLVSLALPVFRRSPGTAARMFEAVRGVPITAARIRLYRGWSWPVASRLGTRVVVRVHGGRMECDTADVLGRVVAVSGTWEPNSTALVRRLLSPGDVAVDVGAHAGYYTLLCTELVGAGGRVYAFEPSPARYRELCANIERSGASNVTAFEVAAGATEGRAVLHEAPRPNTSASTMAFGALESPAVASADDYEPVEVRIVPIESRIAPEDTGRIRLIKIDVEGYEVQALKGAERILEAASPLAVLVEVSPAWSADGPAYVQALCERHGLECWRIANDYSVPGYFPRRLVPPVPITEIPGERSDLVLSRGFAHTDITGESVRLR